MQTESLPLQGKVARPAPEEVIESPPQGQGEVMDNEKLTLIEEVVKREWDMFQLVHNEGGRASCQDDWPTFHIMRSCQYKPWPIELVAMFNIELMMAENAGRNLVMEKYARMMKSTAPARYKEIEQYLPYISPDVEELAEQIISIHKKWMIEHRDRYPKLSARGRYLFTEEDTEWETSSETYLRGELLTWSKAMLKSYYEFVRECEKDGVNLVIEQDKYTVREYGYETLEEAEERC